jgi:hypothetical protein
MNDDYAVGSSEEELEEELEQAAAVATVHARAPQAPSTWARGPRAPGGAAPGSDESVQWSWLEAFPPRAACREPARGGGAAQRALDKELGLLARAFGASPLFSRNEAELPAPSRAAQDWRASGDSDHEAESAEDMEQEDDASALAEREKGPDQPRATDAPDDSAAMPAAGCSREADSEDEEEAAERLAATAAAAGLLDEAADELDRKWVDVNLRDGKGGNAGRKRASDALLSCPGCFTSLCFDCRAIGRGGHEFRAERAFNCERKGSELHCGECSTIVGRADELGAITFTNVLPSAI